MIDQTHGTPSFGVEYSCPDDLATIGRAYLRDLWTSTAADMHASRIGDGMLPAVQSVWHASGVTHDGVTQDMPAGGSVAGFDAAWYDGHVADVRVYSFHRTNSPDPRDDGCYVQAIALVK